MNYSIIQLPTKILSADIRFDVGSENPAKFEFGDFLPDYITEIANYLDKIDFANLALSEKENYAVKDFCLLYNAKVLEGKNEYIYRSHP